MAHTSTTGRTPGLSMAEFNARAKKIAASTGEVGKGATRTSTPSRFRRDAAARNAPKLAQEETETTETAESAESSEG